MLKVYNTLSRKKEVFRPRRPGKVRKVNLFVCGITSYDFSHIGHARTYIVFDVITKYLREKGFDVFYLQNITDIDDKIIKRAREKKISPQKLARAFEKEYLKDMKSLKIDSVTKYARATEHIKEIISQVERLLKKGYAYQIEDGIYYDISKFKDYGKLSKRTVLQAEDAVSRIDESKEKRNRGDFCLWKRSKPGEPKWRSPFGLGRPGWHIEDTAITEKYFGPQYDIHGGAKDLIFPHHEAEIAQMEAISGKKPMVKYWLHSGFLTVRGQKMAKSLGNFITIRDFLKRDSFRTLRFLVIKSHYRSPIDYSERLLSQTKKELERIDEFVDKLSRITVEASPQQILKGVKKKFELAMEDDFNTPKVVAAIFDLVNKGNKLIEQNKLKKEEANDILAFLRDIDKILGIDLAIKNIHYSVTISSAITFELTGKPVRFEIKGEKIPDEIIKLVKERKKCRKEGLWQKADEIRRKIKEMGYLVEDTKKGPKIKKI
ncbi:MAG: cysteine--tRNA ligase [Candidatus Nealsonbacteria bacterium]|nr:MAG: cysteine--tRNA ligase [Candidatus Nealsonbacteria bacterium]